MAITHEAATRDVVADAVVDRIDGGTGAGTIDIGTAAYAIVLATLTFSDPAAGASSSGVKTFNAITEDSSATGGGSAVVFRTRTSDPTDIFFGTCSLVGGGGDMELSSLLINNGDTVQLGGPNTYTAPA